jgi:hypothetical protein
MLFWGRAKAVAIRLFGGGRIAIVNKISLFSTVDQLSTSLSHVDIINVVVDISTNKKTKVIVLNDSNQKDDRKAKYQLYHKNWIIRTTKCGHFKKDTLCGSYNPSEVSLSDTTKNKSI